MTSNSASYRKWMGWIMASVLVLSLIGWYVTRETLPREIRIASASEGGLYHRFALALGQAIEKRTGRKVTVRPTLGSVENRKLLLSGEVDLAILQGGSVDVEGLGILAPLYQEAIHVIARRGRGIESIQDLKGKRILIGPEGSGMRSNALHLLAQYRMEEKDLLDNDHYFLRLLEDDTYDGAIVTTGFPNPDLKRLLRSGAFDLIPVLDAKALAVHHYFFKPIEIPRGLYAEGRPVPAEDLPSAACTNFLASHKNIPQPLIDETLGALYGSHLQRVMPLLMSPKQATEWSELSLHPGVRAYHDPYGGIGLLANFMESIAAIKELLFAFGAGCYLLWDRRRRVREELQKKLIKEGKEKLDVLLNETVVIERSQIETNDPAQLKYYLDEVTRIKLKALEELTHEELRGDQMFAIFLTQCANLIRKIQSKMPAQYNGRPSDVGLPSTPREGSADAS